MNIATTTDGRIDIDQQALNALAIAQAIETRINHEEQ